jgi:hypothetical protein
MRFALTLQFAVFGALGRYQIEIASRRVENGSANRRYGNAKRLFRADCVYAAESIIKLVYRALNLSPFAQSSSPDKTCWRHQGARSRLTTASDRRCIGFLRQKW